MELIRNPFADPEFWTFIVRTLSLMAIGPVIMAATQIKNLKGMVKSLGFKKFVSWLVILPSLLVVIYSGRLPFLAFVVFMLWTSSTETLNMLRVRPFFRKVFLFNQLVTVLVLVLCPDNVHLLPLFYMVSTFAGAGLRNRMHEIVKQIAFAIIGSIWIGYFLALLVMLRDGAQGPTLMTVIMGGVVLSDVFAYLCGGIGKKIKLGTTALASNISPNKVIAGVFGNILGLLIAMLAYGLGLGFSWPVIVVLVVLGGLAATYGDLAESIIKRHAGVKDSSTLIPFHGGMMDRIDSLLFVTPVFYLILNISFDCPLF